MTEGVDSEARYRRPESVLVIVHTPTLDCLLLERVRPEGFWQSVTGTLKHGETPAEAAAREVLEETGLPGRKLRDAGVSNRFPILPEWRERYAPDVVENIEHLWYLEVAEASDIVMNRNEHRAWCWLSIGDAIEKVSSWTNREGLERLRRERESL